MGARKAIWQSWGKSKGGQTLPMMWPGGAVLLGRVREFLIDFADMWNVEQEYKEE